MEQSRKFFRNDKCDLFPCHEVPDVDKFNCILCFCPLYSLGEKCGGNFVMKTSTRGQTVKSCLNCNEPHLAENFDMIMTKLTEAYFR